MAKKKFEPESSTDVGKQLFKRIWVWVAGKPWWAKILAGLAIILVLFAACRLKFLGEPYYGYAKIFLLKKTFNRISGGCFRRAIQKGRSSRNMNCPCRKSLRRS